MKSTFLKAGGAVAVAAVIVIGWHVRPLAAPPWTDAEINVLRSLSLASLPELPPDPSNAVADNPDAAAFGERLFFDPRLSANGGISCATCHQPVRHFTDGLPKGQAIGTSKRNTPSIVGSAYSPWLYWDGRRDSQWAQALSPLEDPNEHGSSRLEVVAVVAGDEAYRASYEALFGEFGNISGDDPVALNTAFANVGKAIAAFERTLLPAASRFDDYVAALNTGDVKEQETLFSDDEVQGLRLFIGKANCTQCHNGPLFTNNEFHNTGVLSSPGELPDKGRAIGVREVLADPFNCFGDYSDDPKRQCAELTFVRTGPELIGAVRTPSLRNVEMTSPYMQKGQVATLAEVLRHYNEAPDAMIGHNEAKPLALGTRERRQLETFLKTLTAADAVRQFDSM
ncbi:MAG: cytochrome-c peroxidase [Gammaproteobacteria bacterium]|nr:cytochrome-c peroxidase [Gammaproteobacteria bacterium]MDH3362175.1 cytochrome-c peroxidase [Gammaproteobacteria bacterium]MDH3480697.1 cytochrome-c peroxidase [Gammaproteobacteria bacterium]